MHIDVHVLLLIYHCWLQTIVCLTILGQQFTNNVESISCIYALPHVKFFLKSPLFAGVFTYRLFVLSGLRLVNEYTGLHGFGSMKTKYSYDSQDQIRYLYLMYCSAGRVCWIEKIVWSKCEMIRMRKIDSNYQSGPCGLKLFNNVKNIFTEAQPTNQCSLVMSQHHLSFLGFIFILQFT